MWLSLKRGDGFLLILKSVSYPFFALLFFLFPPCRSCLVIHRLASLWQAQSRFEKAKLIPQQHTNMICGLTFKLNVHNVLYESQWRGVHIRAVNLYRPPRPPRPRNNNNSNEKLKKRHAAPAYNCVEPFELSATHFVSLIKTMQPFFCGKHQRQGISNFDNLWSRVSQEIQYSCRHRGSSFFLFFFFFSFSPW